MRTQYSIIKRALKEILESKEPLLETVLLSGKANAITSIGYRMGLKVWVRQCLISDPYTMKVEKIWKVGIKSLPDKRR